LRAAINCWMEANFGKEIARQQACGEGS